MKEINHKKRYTIPKINNVKREKSRAPQLKYTYFLKKIVGIYAKNEYKNEKNVVLRFEILPDFFSFSVKKAKEIKSEMA